MHRGRDALFESFMNAMGQHGYIHGQTITIEPRFAHGVLERTTDFAEELVQKNVDIIVAIGAVGARAGQKATSTIPIVFAIVLDPVETGLVKTYDHPGGNLTGVTNYDPNLALEQLSLLGKVVKGLDRVTVLSDAGIPRQQGWNSLERSCEVAAAKLGIALDWVRTRGPTPDWAEIFNNAVRSGGKAVQVLEVPVNVGDYTAIAKFANESRIPAIFPGGRQHGGLLSYGTSLLDTIPKIPPLIDLIRDGTLPGDIPIREVRQHHLSVNLGTARLIGMEMPDGIVASAHEIVG
jgi:putative ABC transport system substrate-binding protein